MIMAYTPYTSPYTYSQMAPPSFAGQPIMQPMAAPQQTQSGFVCRPVTSRAEVEAYQIPFDGSATYFVDTSNGKIYSKAFDFASGSAPIVTYVREVQQVVRYATIEDLEALRDELTKKGAQKIESDK